MNIKDAIKLFAIKDISAYDIKTLKKDYRRLMMKNHPDLGGATAKAIQINESYAILKEFISNIEMTSNCKSKKQQIIFISLQDLIDIYDGNEIVISYANENINVNKYNLRSYRVIVYINTEVVYNGFVHNYSKMCSLNSKDTYSVWNELLDINVFSEASINVKVLNKSIETTIQNNRMCFKFKLSHNIEVEVNIERCESTYG